MSEVAIQFFGAAETVTGSRFLVTHENIQIMVDCGMFQGERAVEALNEEAFAFDVRGVSAVLLTHGHLDHCGALPILVKNGYEGPIYCSEYTKKITEVVLMDSAHLQMQEAKFDDGAKHKSDSNLEEHPNRAHKAHSESHPQLSGRHEERNSDNGLALYSDKDVLSTMTQFRSVKVRDRIEIYPEVFATFFPSGHILGATFVLLEIGGKAILFTGDLGRGNHPLLVGPDIPPQVHIDAVITESTYGATSHDTNIAHFADELNEAMSRGGSILIPAFAVDRTEEILFELRRIFNSGVVKQLPVFVDSPMAETVLNFYREAVSTGAVDIKKEVSEKFLGSDPFQTGVLQELYTTDESKMLNEIKEQCIIISASGMATGGRVTYHLEHMLPEPKNTVILVGYQGRGTRGLLLEQGAENIRIRGAWIPVKAHIATAMNFSVHADQGELISWLKQVLVPNQVFIVHGERESQQAMKSIIESQLHTTAIIPELKKVYQI